jgi:hypothetical protein
LLNYFHFTQGHCSREVLEVQGTQTGGVEFAPHDAVSFAQVDRVDMVTAHQINDRHLHQKSIHSGRYGQNLIGGIWHQEVGVGEGEQKWV